MIAAVKIGLVRGVSLGITVVSLPWVYALGQWINGTWTGHHGFYLH